MGRRRRIIHVPGCSGSGCDGRAVSDSAATSKSHSVVVTAKKRNKSRNVVALNRKESTMKKSTETKQQSAVEVQGKAEVIVNTRVSGQFTLKLKKLAVATSMGLAAFAASLPELLCFKNRKPRHRGAFCFFNNTFNCGSALRWYNRSCGQ
ncbi:hypothetical protein D9M72_489050 [compost metagenome]